ncbi:hypothetical protein NPX13_g11161 [Xylaria arbuscula]|uniref:Uncharacterized protein n=1 Tax=Xylaria arbuscula TaxID=114810 RepID=A0A9W8N3P0_9PEZI|nr:hypothetical protein NPX13_g11161 [Xylaria arbuscula]
MSNTSVHPNNDYVCLCFINGVLSEEEPKEHDNVVYVIGVRPVEAVPTRGDVRYVLPRSGPNVPRCTICQVALKGSETHAFIAMPACRPTKSGNVAVKDIKTSAARSRFAFTAFSILVRPAKILYSHLQGRRIVEMLEFALEHWVPDMLVLPQAVV